MKRPNENFHRNDFDTSTRERFAHVRIEETAKPMRTTFESGSNFFSSFCRRLLLLIIFSFPWSLPLSTMCFSAFQCMRTQTTDRKNVEQTKTVRSAYFNLVFSLCLFPSFFSILLFCFWFEH